MQTILTSEQGGIRTLTLNRPTHRNALTPAMQTHLIEAFADAEASPTTRVLVLTGAGEAFCSGLDLAALQAMQHKSAVELADDAHRIAEIFRSLYELSIPTIAAVNGHAIAGGTGLTLQVGEKRARDLLLTARLFTAEEAHSYGLVTEIVSPESLQLRVEVLAQSLIANSPSSLRATKHLLADQNRAWLDAALHLSLKANATSRTTADFHEGIAAFLEKRKPTWSQTSPNQTSKEIL
jgi:methylglutaconyl-CoA hydratase